MACPHTRPTLSAVLQRRHWSVSGLAWVVGCSNASIEDLIDSSVFMPEMALRLEAALGVDARQWLGVPDASDLEALAEELGGELARIRRRATGPHLRPSDGPDG